MTEPRAFFDRWQTDSKKMHEAAPQAVRAFGTLFQSLMSDGALTTREKELIALSIALTERCEPCLYLHVEKCFKAGATRDQILEAAGVAVVMRGGPAYTHLPEIVHAIEYVESKK